MNRNICITVTTKCTLCVEGVLLKFLLLVWKLQKCIGMGMSTAQWMWMLPAEFFLSYNEKLTRWQQV